MPAEVSGPQQTPIMSTDLITNGFFLIIFFTIMKTEGEIRVKELF